MDSNYRPQSPDLSSYAPQSPDLSGFQQSPNLAALGQAPYLNYAQPNNTYTPENYNQPQNPVNYGGGYGGNGAFSGHYPPTSVPQLPSGAYHQQQYVPPGMMPQQIKYEDNSPHFTPDSQGTAKRPRRVKQEPGYDMHSQAASYAAAPAIKSELPDPTLGCQLKTSFPVARIKRLMQADEDIGKVAQVTPTVVSRALELFMIKIISASADQARGGAAGGAAAGKGPRRILVQHLKKAVLADETFDFLTEIVNKVPDAPSKAKKDNGSDSEDGGKTKKRGKRRKDSGDDF